MYEEKGQSSLFLTALKYLLLFGLLLWGLYEWSGYKDRNYEGIRMVIYLIAMIGFWFWLYGFQYTVQIEKKEIRIIRTFFRWENRIVIRRADIIGICDKFSRKYCYGSGVRKLLHQYSWANDHRTRAILCSHKGSKRAVLIKGSHEMLKVFEEKYPHLMIYVDD